MEGIDGNDDRFSARAGDAFFSGVGYLKKVDISGEHLKDFAIGHSAAAHLLPDQAAVRKWGTHSRCSRPSPSK